MFAPVQPDRQGPGARQAGRAKQLLAQLRRLVRTVLVPAMMLTIGDRVWSPGQRQR
jgi:hypothetical protein